MTQKSKVILLSSILLALCVIGSTMMTIFDSNWSLSNTSTLLFTVGIFLISISSVFFIYFKKIVKKPDEKKLNKVFFRQFEMFKDIILSSSLPKNYKMNIIEDVLEMLLTAQFDGRDVDSTLGDPESFAKDIISACINKPKSVMNHAIDSAIAFILFTMLISSFLWLEDISKDFFAQRIDISMIIFYAIISFVLYPVIRLFIMKKSIWAYTIPLLSGIAFIAITKLLRVYFYETNLVKTLLDDTIGMIPNLGVLVFWLIALMLLYVLRINIRRLPNIH